MSWFISQPLERLLARDPELHQSVLRQSATLVGEAFSPYKKGAHPAPLFDRNDAYYFPVGRFSGIVQARPVCPALPTGLIHVDMETAVAKAVACRRARPGQSSGSASASWAALSGRPRTGALRGVGPPTNEGDSASSSAPPLATREDVTTAYKLLLRRPPGPTRARVLRALRRSWLHPRRAGRQPDELGRVPETDVVPLLPGELRPAIRRHSLGGRGRHRRSRRIRGTVSEPRTRTSGAPSSRPVTTEPALASLPGAVGSGRASSWSTWGPTSDVSAFQAARLVGEQGRVVAIEPNPDNVQLLFAGILMNEWANVQVWPCAAWDAAGIMSLKGGESNTYVVFAAPLEEGHAHYTQLIRIDEALAGRGSDRSHQDGRRRPRASRPSPGTHADRAASPDPRDGVQPPVPAGRRWGCSPSPTRSSCCPTTRGSGSSPAFGDDIEFPSRGVADDLLRSGETPS